MGIIGFFKRKGKTHPIKESNRQRYTGQVSESSWKKASVHDVKKEKKEHPWATKKQAEKIAVDHSKSEKRKTYRVGKWCSSKTEAKAYSEHIKARPDVKNVRITATTKKSSRYGKGYYVNYTCPYQTGILQTKVYV